MIILVADLPDGGDGGPGRNPGNIAPPELICCLQNTNEKQRFD